MQTTPKTDVVAICGGLLAGTDGGQTPEAILSAAAASVAVYLIRALLGWATRRMRTRDRS